MEDIMTVKEAAAKWELTEYHVTDLIRKGRIKGAYKIGTAWVMPADTQKPLHMKKVKAERKRREAEATQASLEVLSEPFKALIGNQGLNYQFYDLLPIPIEVFSSDGTCVFMNRAWQELHNFTDPSLTVGKYNLKNDPVCLEIMGQESMDKVFRGEAWSDPDFPIPIQDALERGVISEKPYEAATMNMFMLPIWDGDTFAYTVCFATVKNMYKGRADIAKAQAYIDEHWKDEFDLDKTAHSANLSKRHFQRIFKEVTDSTPIEYYHNVKINKIKEKLSDETLSIEQVFEACGVNSRNLYLKLFKEKTGMSPLEYRKNTHKK